MSEILEGESIFFRHAAKYYAGGSKVKARDKYLKGDGDLCLTSHRILFNAASGGENFETVWANVSKDIFSVDGPKMMKIEFEHVSDDDFIKQPKHFSPRT